MTPPLNFSMMRITMGITQLHLEFKLVLLMAIAIAKYVLFNNYISIPQFEDYLPNSISTKLHEALR